MKKVSIYLIIVFSILSVHAQNPNINWQKSYSGTGDNVLDKIIETRDLGYIIVGLSVNIGLQGWHARITRIDSSLEIAWEKDLPEGTQLYDVQQTSDNGYLVGGVEKTGEYFTESYHILKMDENGNEQWRKTFAGDRFDFLISLEETADGGYILGGHSNSLISGDKTEVNYGRFDYWIIKLDSVGNIEWQKTLGGDEDDLLKAISQTSDGGYIVAGTSESGISGVKTEASRGDKDYWIVKIDATGDILWQKTIGGDDTDEIADMKVTRWGGYILTGTSKSNISGEKTQNSEGLNDYWVVKLNAAGAIVWQKTLGGSDEDIATSIIQTVDNGYLVGGYSKSDISGDKSQDSRGGRDYWVIKLDVSGNILWQSTLGGDESDYLTHVEQNIDGSVLFGGHSYSDISGDKTVPGHIGISSYWVINYANILGIENFNTQGKLFLYPNPVQSVLNIETIGNSIENIKIYDINGRVIRELKNLEKPFTMDLSRLESGIYLVEISDGGQTLIRKIIKE